jgi:protein-S-isoprenylcysteine O-methyltransferase Ste14
MVSSVSAAQSTPDDAEKPETGIRPRVKKAGGATVWHRATARWAAITAVMMALLVLYTQHPYYKGAQFAPWRPFYTTAFFLWLAFGVFYVKATMERFHERRYVVRDGGLHLILLAKAFQEKRFWRVAKNPRVRTTILGICVKGFFTPLMTGFVVNHTNAIAGAWLRHKGLPPLKIDVPAGLSILGQASAWFAQFKVRAADLVPAFSDFGGLLHPDTWTRADVSWGLGLAYDIVFFVDCGWALMGYTSESRWLGNKTRSVEPTPFGWLVCLACYPPYNNVLGTYLPLNDGAAIITSETTLLVFRAVTVLLFAIYASATVSFGFKFSNLTHRGVVTRGPYSLVRHPAYLCKCAAWWLEHIPRMTITKAFFLSLLCGVYALRAWTEERHLGRDPEYQAYKKKVRWVLFPGVY